MGENQVKKMNKCISYILLIFFCIVLVSCGTKKKISGRYICEGSGNYFYTILDINSDSSFVYNRFLDFGGDEFQFGTWLIFQDTLVLIKPIQEPINQFRIKSKYSDGIKGVKINVIDSVDGEKLPCRLMINNLKKEYRIPFDSCLMLNDIHELDSIHVSWFSYEATAIIPNKKHNDINIVLDLESMEKYSSNPSKYLIKRGYLIPLIMVKDSLTKHPNKYIKKKRKRINLEQ